MRPQQESTSLGYRDSKYTDANSGLLTDEARRALVFDLASLSPIPATPEQVWALGQTLSLTASTTLIMHTVSASTSSLDDLQDYNVISELRERVTVLEAEVVSLRKAVTSIDEPDARGKEPRRVSKTKAANEIKEFFEKHHGEDMYADDIAEALNLDIQMVIDLLETLTKQGQIRRVEQE